MRMRRHGAEEELEFQIAPMIDVLLTVLVFFIMITSASVLQGDPDIQLPVAENATKPEKSKAEAVLNLHWKPEAKAGWVVMDSATTTSSTRSRKSSKRSPLEKKTFARSSAPTARCRAVRPKSPRGLCRRGHQRHGLHRRETTTRTMNRANSSLSLTRALAPALSVGWEKRDEQEQA